MNQEEQQDYQERMSGPEMEYLQWLSEKPEYQAYAKTEKQKQIRSLKQSKTK